MQVRLPELKSHQFPLDRLPRSFWFRGPNEMSMRPRFKKLVNWTLQGPIILRLMGHFAAFNVALLALLLVMYGMRVSLAAATETPAPAVPASFWEQAAPVAVCMVLMTPFMLWDLLKLSNRIAGPLFRFETLMKEFQDTGVLRTATLRDGDLLREFETNFNRFAEKLHTLHPATKPDDRSTPETRATVPFRQSVS